MNGLVVVHCDLTYGERDDLSADALDDLFRLYHTIDYEIERVLGEGGKVYFLAEEAESPDKHSIVRCFREKMPQMEFIQPSYERQFLRAKEKILEDELAEVDVAGVAYDVCVKDMYNLIKGSISPDNSMENYESARKRMGWSKERFDKVFNTVVKVHLRKDLIL